MDDTPTVTAVTVPDAAAMQDLGRGLASLLRPGDLVLDRKSVV